MLFFIFVKQAPLHSVSELAHVFSIWRIVNKLQCSNLTMMPLTKLWVCENFLLQCHTKQPKFGQKVQNISGSCFNFFNDFNVLTWKIKIKLWLKQVMNYNNLLSIYFSHLELSKSWKLNRKNDQINLTSNLMKKLNKPWLRSSSMTNLNQTRWAILDGAVTFL